MGLVASTYSDVTIVTSDNPRSEDPDTIIDAIMSGVVPGTTVLSERPPSGDRRRSRNARRGDVVVARRQGSRDDPDHR
jgi:UDP-N-acetylmuramoyl-L-alanyl-D-glutamate--2,6-diaminopimelate ligase